MSDEQSVVAVVGELVAASVRAGSTEMPSLAAARATGLSPCCDGHVGAAGAAGREMQIPASSMAGRLREH